MLILLTALVATPGFLKGQTHLHSARSGDSRTPPDEVVRWYEARGYDFIVFTDHDYVTLPKGRNRMLVIPGVELTQNYERCQPAPEAKMACLLHVNALFVGPEKHGRIAWPKLRAGAPHRKDLYKRAIDLTRTLGGLAQLNHPNFHYAADAALLIELVDNAGLKFFEVANMAWDSNNEGDSAHPSTEAMWDQVLSKGRLIYGVATDDAHHYGDAKRSAQKEDVFVGDLGFVMVRAARNPAAIRGAMARGDFYSSNGVVLKALRITPKSMVLETERPHRFRFIGQGGALLLERKGRRARFSLGDKKLGYVRAEVIAPDGTKAWIQPVGAFVR